jgi:hypothetical protein
MVFCCTMFQSAGFFELQHKLSPPHDPYSLKEISGGLVNSLSFDYYRQRPLDRVHQMRHRQSLFRQGGHEGRID